MFGAIALVGILGVGVSNFIKGPLTSSVKITRTNVAESAMAVTAQVSVMAAASQANCDADAIVEPLPYKVTSLPRPVGGGYIPDILGTNKIDPWGTQYGYCVWDHGASSCGSPQRLAGTATNPDGQTVIALVSAGPDKTFTTTCRTFAAADTNADGDLADAGDLALVSKAASTDDDILFTYSYAEASGASGGLWTLKSSDPNVATIGKNLEVTGGSTFSGDGTFTGINTDTLTARTGDFIEFLDGLKLPDKTSFNPTCSGTMVGVIRRNGSAIEMCVGTTWTAVSGGGGSGGTGGASFPSDTTGVCNGGTAGNVRYNTSLNAPQYCDGTSWKGFVTQAALAQLSVTPLSSTANVTGPCTANCPYKLGTPVDFQIVNTGNATTGTLTYGVTGPNPSSAYVDTVGSTCDNGITLAPGASCLLRVQPSVDGNYNYVAYPLVTDGSVSVYMTMTGTGSGFSCTPGAHGWGGLVVTCANATTPDYVLQEAGCAQTSYEPACTGVNAQDPLMTNYYEFSDPDGIWDHSNGALTTVNGLGYKKTAALTYCDNLVKDGYSNWYMPSYSEFSGVIYANRSVLNFPTSGSDYYSMAEPGSRNYYGYDALSYLPFGNTITTNYGYQPQRVRCLRRHGAAVPTLTPDTTPTIYTPSVTNYGPWPASPSVDLGAAYTSTSGASVKSMTQIIRGINTSVAVSVSGSGSPTVSINGASPTTTATAYPESTMVVYANAPATMGTENLVTVNIGSTAFTFAARLVNSANTRKIFITTTTYNGNLGGLAGADAKCQTVATAAGQTGNWVALLSTTGTFFKDRIPWNWARAENMGGELIANDVNDLYLGRLNSPIRYNQSGILSAQDNAWTGTETDGAAFLRPSGYTDHTCQNWTSTSATWDGYSGAPASIDYNWQYNAGTRYLCNTNHALFCMGPF